jgi:hypothetical protein
MTAHNLFVRRRLWRWSVFCSRCGHTERIVPGSWLPSWGCRDA